MSVTVRDQVNEVRSQLQGALPDAINVLGEDYTAGDEKITLRYANTKIVANMVISADLNTWYVLEADSGGRTFTILPSYDGGPDTNLTAGAVVRVKPRHTTWAIFREWNNQVLALSSPDTGLYAYGAFEANNDWQNGTYPLPTTGLWATANPVRLLVARYRRQGFDSWQRIDAEYQPENATVRIYGPPPNSALLEFVFAFPFTNALTLDATIESCGLTEHTVDIPGLGVCARLSRTTESRRNQLHSQGDSKRLEEVQAGANLGVSRDWAAEQQRRINQEAARLVRLIPYSTPMPGVTGRQ